MGNRIWGRQACFALAIGWTCIAAADEDIDRRVSINMAATPLAKALPEIGNRCGIKMQARKTTLADVVVVHVKDVTVRELMKRIAWAVDAEWDKKDDAWTLQRSATQDRKERGAAIADMAKAIYQMLILKESEGLGGPKIEVAGRGILRAIDLEQVLSLVPGERLVYSTAPTQLQSAMPPTVKRVIEDYWRKVEADRAAGNPPESPVFVGMRKPPSGPAVKALLVITRGIPIGADTSKAFDLNIVLANAAGDVLHSFGVHLVFGPAAGEGKVETPIQESAKLDLDRDALDLAATICAAKKASDWPAGENTFYEEDYALHTLRSGVAMAPLDAKWTDRLSHPDATDPLAWTASPVFVKSAEALKANLVACIPDSILVPVAEFVAEPRSVADAMTEAQTKWRMKVEREGDWLCARPIDLAHARDWRTDRAALGRACTALAARGILNIDEKADFATAQPLGRGDGFDMALLHCFNPAITELGAGAGNVSAQLLLRFLHSFVGAERRLLLAGEAIPVRSLLPAQKSTLAWLMSNSGGGPDQMPDPNAPGDWVPHSHGQSWTTPAPSADHPDLPVLGTVAKDVYKIWEEPTEWLAGPWGQDATIAGDANNSRQVLIWNRRSTAKAMLGLDSLVERQSYNARPRTEQDPPPLEFLFELYAPAQGQVVGLSLRFEPRFRWNLGNLRDHRLDPKAKGGSEADLPAEYLKDLSDLRRARGM